MSTRKPNGKKKANSNWRSLDDCPCVLLSVIKSTDDDDSGPDVIKIVSMSVRRKHCTYRTTGSATQSVTIDIALKTNGIVLFSCFRLRSNRCLEWFKSMSSVECSVLSSCWKTNRKHLPLDSRVDRKSRRIRSCFVLVFVTMPLLSSAPAALYLSLKESFC